MKPKRRGIVILRNFLLYCLMAVVCIGGVELAVCRVEDPALFSELVSPVTDTYRRVTDGVTSFMASVAAEIEERRAAAARAKALAEAKAQAEAEARARALAAAQREAEEAEELAKEAQIASRPAIHTDFTPADPTITELIAAGDTEYLLGGNVLLTYFNQADEQWATKPFGIDPIGSHGCGPTSLAMAVTSLTGETVTPEEMAAWTAKAGYSAPHGGSYLGIVEGTAAHYGLDCAPLESLDAETLCHQLGTGGVMVALMGPGHFTRGGHFILLHGVTLSGEVLVADPYSRENSLMTWDPQLIIDELSGSRYSGAPLWVLSAPSNL